MARLTATRILLALFLFTLLAAPLIAAHGDDHEDAEKLEATLAHYEKSRRSLEKCSHKLKTRERLERRLNRRNEMIESHLLKKRAEGMAITPNPLHKRQTFGDLAPRQSACILAPEVTVGPYYVPAMLIRPDIRETQPGISLLIDMEVVDVNTCDVVPNAMVDFWHCNTTGIYSGFAAEGTTGLTFNRGLQPTDSSGIVQITTTFPGWYRGRATHIHIATHHGGTITNSHYVGGTVSHIGQLFFPENILSQIDQAAVYRTNTVARLLNANDGIYRQQNTGYNALTTVSLLGSTISQGVVASITLGVDLDATRNIGGGGGGGPPAKH